MIHATIAGYKVVIVQEAISVKRNWIERLTELPWRPLVSHKIVPTHWEKTLKGGVIISEVQGVLYCTAAQYRVLEAATHK